jgi:hypothetical protein
MISFFLAHQGGWDELLMFLLPIALVVATWYVLERRRGRESPSDRRQAAPGDEAARREDPAEPPQG